MLGQSRAQRLHLLVADAHDEPVVAHHGCRFHHLHQHQSQVTLAHGHRIDIQLRGLLTQHEHPIDDGHRHVVCTTFRKTLDDFDGTFALLAFEVGCDGRRVGQCDFSERYHSVISCTFSKKLCKDKRFIAHRQTF